MTSRFGAEDPREMAQEPDAEIELDMGADASRTVGNALAEQPPAASMDVFESEGAFGGGRLAQGFRHRAFRDMAAVQRQSSATKPETGFVRIEKVGFAMDSPLEEGGFDVRLPIPHPQPVR